jgi:tetratricopeptide (TPR) repeat protein
LLFFAGTLFPALGFFNVYPFLYSFVADHFQYLAGIGPIALAAGIIATVLSRWGRNKPFLKPVLCGALLLVLAVLTWRQAGMYADNETLWQTTLARNPDSFLANNNIGVILVRKGQLEAAIAHFQKTLQSRPDDPEAHDNLGIALAKVHGDYANKLVGMGRDDEAIVQFRKALEICPAFADARHDLAVILLQKGQVDEAIAQFREILGNYPDDAMASFDLGNAYFQKGQMDEAVASFQRALKIKPDDVSARNNLGMAFLKKGMVDEAAVQFQKALARQPDFALARTNLDKARLQKEHP